MPITDSLVLASDVVLVAVTELAPEVRRQLTWQEGDFAITRPRSRTPSRIVDAPSAALLRQFEKPCTVSEAVISFSRERKADPEATLLDAYPLLDALVRTGFLVTEGSGEGQRIQPSLDPGREIAGFTVLGCVQVLEDTELYQVRGAGPARLWPSRLHRHRWPPGCGGKPHSSAISRPPPSGKRRARRPPWRRARSPAA